ncbi:MAG: hypothetical protein KKF48_03560 [Nanoarchaeota archaeon]|nr:hypothetical protein [Nanoarchaeota archaeon]MBU1028097.1 hypothetical protein [Nanoarchaeota archaeon]
MKIVVDTNILFSFFWKNSVTRKLLIASNFELIAPELVFNELKKYSNEIIKKTKITKQFFKNEFLNLKKIIDFVNYKEYTSYIKAARKIFPDRDDAELFALCLRYSCFLWSNDSILKKQDKIKVFSTDDLIESLF